MFDITLLKEALYYNGETGKFTWKQRPIQHFKKGVRTAEQKCGMFNRRYAGTKAINSKTSNGYYAGTLFGKHIKAHQAAWAIFYGKWPDQEIDHIDRNPLNNKIKNLRLASRQENSCNRSIYKRRVNTSLFKGVSKVGSRWKAAIDTGGNRTYIGLFKTEVVAAVAYDLVGSVLHGEFFSGNFVHDKQAMADFATEYVRKHFEDGIDGVDIEMGRESF